jgi:predicted Zn-dependent protease
MLGEIYRDSDDTLNSVAEFREALRLRAGLSDEATAEVRFEIAEGLVQVRRFDEALAALDEFAGPDGEAPHMRALRVEALTGLGRHPEAAALADRELAAHPDGPFYRLRGQLYLEDGNPEAAIPLLERSVRLSPHHYQSHFLLARAYGAAGRKADAERMKARAEEIQRDYELTATLARQAVARPWDPAVRLQLAELSERVGDAKSAAMWRKAAAQCQARNR